jgi:homoserine dehydrogenase
MSRRHFIKQSGMLAGGLLFSNQWLHAFAGTSEKINIGIIGCGDRGTGIMKMLKDLPDRFAISAICDVLDFRIENAKKSSPSINPTVYKDYRKLLDDRTVQAVVIATTLSEHYHIAKDALLAGKHVYLEKRMTYNIDQAIDLVKVQKRIQARSYRLVINTGQHLYILSKGNDRKRLPG